MARIRLRTALPLLLLVGAAAPAQADLVESLEADVDVMCPYGCIELDDGQLFVRMDPAEAQRTYGSSSTAFCVKFENNVFQILDTLSYYGTVGIVDAIRGGVNVDITCLDAGYIRSSQTVGTTEPVDPMVYILVHAEVHE